MSSATHDSAQAEQHLALETYSFVWSNAIVRSTDINRLSEVQCEMGYHTGCSRVSSDICLPDTLMSWTERMRDTETDMRNIGVTSYVPPGACACTRGGETVLSLDISTYIFGRKKMLQALAADSY